jgi:hypothetical protein
VDLVSVGAAEARAEASEGEQAMSKHDLRAAARLNFHAIIGPNGMCMCGVEADGTVVTCGALLRAQQASEVEALRAALADIMEKAGSHTVEMRREPIVNDPTYAGIYNIAAAALARTDGLNGTVSRWFSDVAARTE